MPRRLPGIVRAMNGRSQKGFRGKSQRKQGRAAAPQAELERLRAELAEARAQLRRVEQEGADGFLAKRLADLEEGRQVARGQAVEATVARARAEAQLQALRDAIGKAPGLSGWLLRRAQRRLG
ncbi:hypothetical protein [Roseomonas haemaphysalidis]|uniref:Uncharacterized protein n=1 Tax=Roseomonas haemaphysalidis TaxID=2768162 RepID=A0ABS3KU22_9PROT|nr:hypothetical protein [Roseomonas haemaphysalidis]MBO1080977.1 hypothetical protein [Roseomonas haemaphysalidis]